MVTSTDNLNKAVFRILQDYCGEAEETIAECIDAVTREAAKKLRSTSPRKTGVYAKSWKASVEKYRNSVEGTVWNPKKYQLTHLLEKGHGPGPIRKWRVGPIPHIAKVEEWAVAQAVRRLEAKL